MKRMTLLALGAFILFQVSPVAGEGRVYTNKDLERYGDAKNKETPVPVKYAGKKVTLDLSDANLSGAITLLSDIARQDGYTLSVDPRVQGKITLKMTNVPWDQVLDFLAENYHLSKVVKDKRILITPGN